MANAILNTSVLILPMSQQLNNHIKLNIVINDNSARQQDMGRGPTQGPIEGARHRELGQQHCPQHGRHLLRRMATGWSVPGHGIGQALGHTGSSGTGQGRYATTRS